MIRKTGHIDTKVDHSKIMRSVRMELELIGLELERLATEYINRKNISVDGDIKDSVKAIVESIASGLRLMFGANVKHAIYVHEGTKPHWPPSKPIRRWVSKKLNPPSSKVGSVTWFVRKKIAEEGTKAKPFLGVPIRIMRERIPSRIEKAIARAS